MEHIATNAWQAVAKRGASTTALTLAMLLTMLLAAAPAALAQGSTAATGVLERAVPHSPDPTPVYAITDAATGTAYELVSGFVDLEQYVGERVTIQGVPVPGPGDPSKPPLLNVTHIEPTNGGNDGGAPVTCQSLDCPNPGNPDDKATLSFELTVDGDPPADAAFYGNVITGEGGPGLYVPLTDPDKDRVYTGTTTVDRFGPGPRPVPAGVEPVSLPVRIVQDSEVIKDFGTVKLDDDKTFKASISFPVDDCPIISPTPEQCGDGGSGNNGDGSGSGGSSGGDGSSGGGNSSGGNGGGSSSGSPDGGSSGGNNGGGTVGSGSGSVGSSGGDAPGGIANGLRGVLPSTGGGGTAFWVLGAGALLAGGGFLIQRLVR